MDSLSKIINTLALVSLSLFPSLLFPQSQKPISQELHYKFRDGNRWEGVKLNEWKPVSGTLDLASLVMYQADFRQHEASHAVNDPVNIIFYTPTAKDITVSVFNSGKKYYMDPHSSNFETGWNLFSWSSTILTAVGLAENNLEGFAKIRLKNRQIYFPIFFINPGKTPTRLIAEFSFTNATVTKKPLEFTLTLYLGFSTESIKTWDSVKLEPYESRSVYWEVNPDLIAKQAILRLVALDKAGVKHNFNILIKLPMKLTSNK